MKKLACFLFLFSQCAFAQVQLGKGVQIGGTGAGGDGLNQLTGDVLAGPGTGSQAATVAGLKNIPFCTGFTPTNGQAVTLTTASSPNPCWTAVTPGGGSSGFPIILGTTSIASGSTTTAIVGISINGVTLSTAGPATQYLDKTGAYSTPAGTTSFSSSLHNYGDSITCGWNGSSCVAAASYAYLLASSLNLSPPSNYSISGSMACDIPTSQIFANSDFPDLPVPPLYTLMIGTNDVGVKGVGSYEAVFNLCQRASLSWLGTPATFKVRANASTVTHTGTGSLDTSNNWNSWNMGASGATVTFPITLRATGTVYLWYRIIDGNAGTGTYALDGTTQGSLTTATTPAIATQLGVTQSMALIRLLNVTSGAHTITVTQTSSSGNVDVVGVGAPPARGLYPMPTIAVGDIPYQQTGYSPPSACTVSDAPCLAYIADIQNNVTALISDGLDLRNAVTRSYMKATAAEMIDAIHPNAAVGQVELQYAFRDALNAIPAVTSGSTGIPTFAVSVQSANYTVTTSDQIVYMNCASACTVTMPDFGTLSHVVTVANVNAGLVSIVSYNGMFAGISQSYNLVQNTGYTFQSYSTGGHTLWNAISDLGGSAPLVVTGPSTNYTVTTNDQIVYMVCPSACTVTMPDFGLVSHVITISSVNSGVVTIVSYNGLFAGMAQSYTLNQNMSYTFHSFVESGHTDWNALSNQGLTGLSGDATAFGSGVQPVTVGKVNGVAYGATPGTNTVPVVTATNVVTYEALPNAALANPSTTVNGQTCTLGGSCTISGGGSTIIQVNGTPTTTATPVNLKNGAGNGGIVVSNPTVGNVELNLSKPFGSGANFTTGPATSITGNIPEFGTTDGSLQDSLTPLSDIARYSLNQTFTGLNSIKSINFCSDVSGSGTAQSCTTAGGTFTPVAGTCVVYTTTTANTGAGLTLNVNSLGAKSVAKWLGSTTLAAGDVAAGNPQTACYNGTVWNLSTIGNAPAGGGAPFPSSPTSALFTYTSTSAGRAAVASDIGSVLKVVESPSYATIELAVTACAATYPCQIDLSSALTQSTSGTYTIPAGVTIRGIAGGSIAPGAGKTLSFVNVPFSGPPVAFFTGAGTITGFGGLTPNVLAEWFGAVGYATNSSAASGTDSTTFIQAALTSISGSGVAQLQCLSYRVTSEIGIHASGVGLQGTCTGSAVSGTPPISTLLSTATGGKVLNISGSSGSPLFWNKISRLNVARGVLPTTSSIGIATDHIVGMECELVNSTDSYTLWYHHDTASANVGFTSCSGGWGYAQTSSYSAATLIAHEIDSSDGLQSASILFRNSGLNCNQSVTSGSTTTGWYIHGTHINDVNIENESTAACTYAGQIVSTGTGTDTNADLHIDLPTDDTCITSCWKVSGLAASGTASVTFNGGYMDSASGSAKIIDGETSDGIAVIGVNINAIGGASGVTGIYCNTCTNFQFQNNIIKDLNTGTGISVVASTGGAITGNTVTARSGAPITLGIGLSSTSVGNNVIGNKVGGAGGTTTTAYSFDGTSLANDVGPNTIYGTVTTAVSGVPTGTTASFLATGSQLNGSLICTAANGLCGGIANITITLPTSALAANTCSSPATATMTGVATTSTFTSAFATNPNAVTGWGTSGGLVVTMWPTSNTLNWSICNQTASSITPGAMTLNVGAK